MRSIVVATVTLGFLALVSRPPLAGAAPPRLEDAVVVGERPFAASLTAYAVVEAVAPVTLPALVDGTLESWSVLPGTVVRKGELLGRLAGPEHAKEVADTRAALERAQSALALAESNEATAHQTYPVISTSQTLAEARAAVSNARSDLHAARARWAFVNQGGEIRAPVSGTVTDVYAGQGQSVAAGTALARLQDASRLWVHAVFYGRDSLELKPGMEGVFAPSGGGAPVAVKVTTVIDPVRPDGGRAVGCQATDATPWLSGEAGTLRLTGAAVSWPAVPESALVLQGQQWYVLVAGPSGEERREVELGPESGGWRAIVKGLQAGERIVAQDAYLRFHRDVSKKYAPPD